MEHPERQGFTYHVFQTFSWVNGEIVADEPQEMLTPEAAIAAVEQMSDRKVGGIAFTRHGNMATGFYSDPVILAWRGTVPTMDEEFV